MMQENNTPETAEVEMKQEEQTREASEPKAIHHATKRGADMSLARREISQESHAAVLKGELSLHEARDLGRNAGPDGQVGQSTAKTNTPKKDKPVTLCIACGKPTKGGCFHPGGDMKMHRIADEHLRGERELTDAQREYLESSGKMEQARKRAEKQWAKEGEQEKKRQQEK